MSIEQIRDLYNQLPHIECKGLCDAWCSGIAPTQAENEQIRRRKGLRLTLQNTAERCPLLDVVTKRCNGYTVRPMICRLWGLTERMRCPHGCEPQWELSFIDEQTFMQKAALFSGDISQEDYDRWQQRLADPEIRALMYEIATHPVRQPEIMHRIREIEKNRK